MAHDVRVKAAAMAAMLTGSGVRETARQFGLPVSTVSRWRQSDVLPILRRMKRPRLDLQRFRMGRKKGKSAHDIDPTGTGDRDLAW